MMRGSGLRIFAAFNAYRKRRVMTMRRIFLFLILIIFSFGCQNMDVLHPSEFSLYVRDQNSHRGQIINEPCIVEEFLTEYQKHGCGKTSFTQNIVSVVPADVYFDSRDVTIPLYEGNVATIFKKHKFFRRYSREITAREREILQQIKNKHHPEEIFFSTYW